MSKPQDRVQPIWLAAAALAWVIPGAGHLYVGRPVRALIIFVTITATFWAGMALGGAFTVDRQNEPWWFMANMVTGANGLIASQIEKRANEQVMDKVHNGASRDDVMAREKLELVAPGDTIARAYAGVAGLLNLLCIFDAAILALMGETGESRPPQAPEANEAPQT